jgi:hypothetical protein
LAQQQIMSPKPKVQSSKLKKSREDHEGGKEGFIDFAFATFAPFARDFCFQFSVLNGKLGAWQL